MDNGIAIKVTDVSKSFKVFYDKGNSLKEKLLFRERNFYELRNVLGGISFDVRKGEAVGIVGENGCGKSTLLKLLSRIMYPDSGRIDVNGRVSALIELGAGFHPDMSGRENIYTNASIFGLSKSEIDARLQDIIDFSELGSYIENPVRTYSSGMYMRLAFSVAINVDAAILLVDEILAVGDAAFQAKCFNRLREIKAKGTTIVIVSHSLGQVEQICDRSIWIRDGQIAADGRPRDVHPVYLDYMGRKNAGAEPANDEAAAPSAPDGQPEVQNAAEAAAENDAPAEAVSDQRWGNGDVRITKVRLLDSDGKETDRFVTGDSFRIAIHYKTRKPMSSVICGIGIFRNDGLQCYGTNTFIDQLDPWNLDGEGICTCTIESSLLLSGMYTLDVAFHAEDGFAYDYYRYAGTFNVFSGLQDVGVMRMPHTWEHKKGNQAEGDV